MINKSRDFLESEINNLEKSFQENINTLHDINNEIQNLLIRKYKLEKQNEEISSLIGSLEKIIPKDEPRTIFFTV